MTILIDFAKKLSHELHGSQFRNDGVTPYTVHTDYVGNNAIRMLQTLNDGGRRLTDSTKEIATAVGYLHDTIEDCVTRERLLEIGKKEHIPNWDYVAGLVQLLSRPDKSVSILIYLAYIRHVDIARAVKLADLEHNMSDLKPGNLRDKYELCKNYLLT